MDPNDKFSKSDSEKMLHGYNFDQQIEAKQRKLNETKLSQEKRTKIMIQNKNRKITELSNVVNDISYF